MADVNIFGPEVPEKIKGGADVREKGGWGIFGDSRRTGRGRRRELEGRGKNEEKTEKVPLGDH